MLLEMLEVLFIVGIMFWAGVLKALIIPWRKRKSL